MNPSVITNGPPVRRWRWARISLLCVFGMILILSIFLYLTPWGTGLREYLAETVITTQHRDWAWIFVGKEKRDQMIARLVTDRDDKALDPLDTRKIKIKQHKTADSLVKVQDISGLFFKGKMMWVSDPHSIRVVVPDKQGEGERITDMVRRTGAVAGVNAGGFDDPDGLGNGFAPIGIVMSDTEVLYTDVDGKEAQHIVGFAEDGTLIVGKYTLDQLKKLKVKEAVSFYPRVIVNGKPLITSGDGGWGRAPRTAVGQTADGAIIFIVIDGRQAHSIGATLKEVQDLFMEQGVVNAGFLDGGASSELVVNNELVTKPSSRYGERRLPSAFLIFDHPESIAVRNPWQGLKTIDPGGAKTHPEYQAELKRKKEIAKKDDPAKRDQAKTHASTEHKTSETERKTAPHSEPVKVKSEQLVKSNNNE